jgi:lipopolysaccharide/colanic/teichoic acid biosynthesis glycosyltransferase
VSTILGELQIQSRGVGLDNVQIRILKIRTIKSNSAVIYEEEKSLRRNTIKNQFLPLGKFLRKTGIDEIPQLINVLSGKMSLIGPRPLLFEDLKRMKSYNLEYDQIRNNLTSKPGISGLWQLERNNELSFEELIRLDVSYETNKSFLLDIKLIIRTFIKIISLSHSDAISNTEEYIPNYNPCKSNHQYFPKF